MKENCLMHYLVPSSIANAHLQAFLRRAFLTITVALLAFPSGADAVSPPPDGDYGFQNTAEGRDALFSLQNGVYGNTALGFNALYANTSGGYNTATGTRALRYNTTGTNNTANGADALALNKTGSNNTAVGNVALYQSTTAGFNTAIGAVALYMNQTGSYNTAIGYRALRANVSGEQNTATGCLALEKSTGSYNTAGGFRSMTSNTTGNSNTAYGTNSLLLNTTGGLNTATGDRALLNNTTGSNNVANGGGALAGNSTGFFNTAAGVNSLYSNTNGIYNVAVGGNALNANTTGRDNTALGTSALYANTTGNNNIALGISAGKNLTTGNNNIVIGHAASAGQTNTIQIGTQGTQTATFIAGISGAVVTGSTVVANASGQIGVSGPSSRRFKHAIEPMSDASEAILELRPVTFRYNEDIDANEIPQFGLVAEEVEKVNPDLVARDADGKAYTVRYEAVNAMLLNEFLKEHRKVETLETSLKELKAIVTEQGAQLQQVRNELQAEKPARRLVSSSE